MSKKIGGVVALVGLCALSLFLLSCGSSSSRPSGLLYVLTEGSNGVGNNVSSFSIDLNSGSVSLLNSNASTCSTLTGSNPVSCGPPLNILLDPSGATAFVLNQGVPCQHDSMNCLPVTNPPTISVPPTIYAYSVGSDGSLSSSGTPIPLSHPTNPQDTEDDADTAVAMVRDAAGTFLFVTNLGSNPPPANCQTDPIPTSNFDACPSISVFNMKVGSTTLTLAGGSPNNPGQPLRLSRIPTALSAITFTPPGGAAQELLFVTTNHDLTTDHNDNTVSVYAVGPDGTLTEQANSPYPAATDPISVLAVNTNPAGQNTGGVFVYVGNQAATVGAVTVFQLCTVVGNNGCTAQDVAANLMVPVGTATSVGQNPVAMLVDPTNNFLYVVSQVSNQVWGLKITTSSGALGLLSPANQPTGTSPVAIALHPSVNNTGQFLFTSNSVASNISGFTLNTTTGAMSNPITVVAPATPSGMTAR